jgi:hypothetical protein
MAAGLVKSSLRIMVNKALLCTANARLNFLVDDQPERRQAAISA